jgi:hypothetical protein
LRRGRGNRGLHCRWRRQFAHDGRQVRAWTDRRDEQFDLAFRLVPGAPKHLFVISRSQVRSKQSDRRQRDRARFDETKDHRKAPHCAGRFDSVVRRVFGQVQRLCAIREERREAFTEIQPARIELHQKCDQMSGCASLVLDGALNA